MNKRLGERLLGDTRGGGIESLADQVPNRWRISRKRRRSCYWIFRKRSRRLLNEIPPITNLREVSRCDIELQLRPTLRTTRMRFIANSSNPSAHHGLTERNRNGTILHYQIQRMTPYIPPAHLYLHGPLIAASCFRCLPSCCSITLFLYASVESRVSNIP